MTEKMCWRSNGGKPTSSYIRDTEYVLSELTACAIGGPLNSSTASLKLFDTNNRRCLLGGYVRALNHMPEHLHFASANVRRNVLLGTC